MKRSRRQNNVVPNNFAEIYGVAVIKWQLRTATVVKAHDNARTEWQTTGGVRSIRWL